ncbi:MAG: hypothetical protein HFH68_07710 [Lachnospiraceae bacterium]|nr:hypothetical protein [Lachnospiraceae bacterium]
MKLKAKILTFSLVPLILLGISLFLVSADRIAKGIYDEAYVGMKATTFAVKDIFEIGHEGDYHLDENGELWKGTGLNISQAFGIVDNIKENTGLEVSIFWNDTRILTSIQDDNGERHTGTEALPEVVTSVLQNGEPYQDRNVEILGKKYAVYYAPLCQPGKNEPVGMIFLGNPQNTVSKIINKIRLQMLLIIFTGIVLASLFIYKMVSNITCSLKMSMGYLKDISHGRLDIKVDDKTLKRKDEIGGIGRSIESLCGQLKSIIYGIREKSKAVYIESDAMKDISQNIYNIMNEINNSIQDISISSHSQAEDAVHAGTNVTQMGDIIETNGMEISKLNGTSENMKKASDRAMNQFNEMNHVINDVHSSIHFLSEQTRLTNEAVSKISAATELITDIASQTNLLSLNASIEASRAGEHGKGFAVVAAEIQKLSQQSDSAAREIKEIVNNLSSHSEQTLDRVEETSIMIGKQEENILSAGESFHNVRNGICETADVMAYVMDKAKQLEDIRMDTVAIVQNSAAISEENTAGVAEIAAEIENVYSDIENISAKTKKLHKLSEEMSQRLEIFSLAK